MSYLLFFALLNNVAVNNLVHVLFIVLGAYFSRELRIIFMEIQDLREAFYCQLEGLIPVGILCVLVSISFFFKRYHLNLLSVFTVVLLPFQTLLRFLRLALVLSLMEMPYIYLRIIIF